jgi:hypothetical protein
LPSSDAAETGNEYQFDEPLGMMLFSFFSLIVNDVMRLGKKVRPL